MSETRPASIEALLAERDWVARLARRLVADASSADDLVQQAWLRFLVRPPRDEGSIRSWLRTVLRNEVLQTHRTDVRRERRENAVPQRPADVAPDEVVARAEEQHRVA